MLHNYSTNSSNILVRMNNISYFLSGLRFLMSTHIHEYIISIRYRTIVWVSLPQISYQKSRMCVEAVQLPSGGPRHRGLAPGLRLQKGGIGACSSTAGSNNVDVERLTRTMRRRGESASVGRRWRVAIAESRSARSSAWSHETSRGTSAARGPVRGRPCVLPVFHS